MNIETYGTFNASEAIPLHPCKRDVTNIRTASPTRQTAKLSQAILESFNMTPKHYEMLEFCSIASFMTGTMIVISGVAVSINSYIQKDIGSLGTAVAVGHGLMFLGISYGIDRGLLRCESCHTVPLFNRMSHLFQISRKNYIVLNSLVKRTYALSAVLSLACLASYCIYKDNIYSAQVNAISMLSSFLSLGMALGTDLSLLNMESCIYKNQT